MTDKEHMPHLNFGWFRRFLLSRQFSREIAVGHCMIGPKRNAVVLLTIDRRKTLLTPTGARKIADQLRSWADHAEAWEELDEPKTMAWKVVVQMANELTKSDVEHAS